jgi:hypothetical protein
VKAVDDELLDILRLTTERLDECKGIKRCPWQLQNIVLRDEVGNVDEARWPDDNACGPGLCAAARAISGYRNSVPFLGQ